MILLFVKTFIINMSFILSAHNFNLILFSSLWIYVITTTFFLNISTFLGNFRKPRFVCQALLFPIKIFIICSTHRFATNNLAEFLWNLLAFCRAIVSTKLLIYSNNNLLGLQKDKSWTESNFLSKWIFYAKQIKAIFLYNSTFRETNIVLTVVWL